ncbi:DeoR/GlpR family DNA-binding transcription regulator [Bacillus spongiae]|uniref:DeoR/GlpR family DNA-binding transcription regulator n=1 Tax=Bacillus spongiae TaxID=2683610 RepID=A0ABU8HDQ4_9BACI
MMGEERREKIIELLKNDGRVIVKELAEIFDVSLDSIRRDLTILEQQNKLKKTYGGAIPSLKVRTSPKPESERYKDPSPSLDAISKTAAECFIKENDTIFIGAAGIQFGMIKHLPTNIKLTVITNSIVIANKLKDFENIDTLLIGGIINSSGSITDTISIDFIKNFVIDVCFVTGGGISKRGITTASPQGASFTRTICQISRERVCLAPSYKIGVDMFAHAAPLELIDSIILDPEAPSEFINYVNNSNINIKIAHVDSL